MIRALAGLVLLASDSESSEDIEDKGPVAMGRLRCPGRWISGEPGALKRSRGSEETMEMGDGPRLRRLRGGSPSLELCSGDDTDVGSELEPYGRVETASGVMKPLDKDKRSFSADPGTRRLPPL